MSCASPSSHSYAFFANSATHLAAETAGAEQRQRQCHQNQSEMGGTNRQTNGNEKNGTNCSNGGAMVAIRQQMQQPQHNHHNNNNNRSNASSTLTVRELAAATPGGTTAAVPFPTRGATVQPPPPPAPPVYSCRKPSVLTAGGPFCCPSSSSSSSPSSSAGGLGKRRSSWSNLVQASERSHLPSLVAPQNPALCRFVRHAQYPSAPGAFDSSRPPSYDEFVDGTHGQNIRHSHTTASRQTSNASSSAKSGEVFAGSKASSSLFRFVGPPAPFPVSAVRSASVQSSTAGGRVSSSSSGARRQIQSQNLEEPKRTKKRDRMQELRNLWAKTGCKLCCSALLITLITLLVTAAILTETFVVAPKRADFSWLPPDPFRAAGQSSRVAMRVGELGEQVRFELTGAPPFKSNFVTVFDFKTNNVAHLDRSLRSASTGRQLVCFVMALDRQQAPGMDQLQRAAKAGAEKNGQLRGWEEDWHFMPNPVSSGSAKLFDPEILECQGARWIELTKAPTDQKGQRCSECFDFCLPDWGVERDAIRDEKYLNVLRRICFHLFVPEWRTFAQSFSTQQNQLDFEQFYRQQQQQQAAANLQSQQVGAVPGSAGGGTLQTKWVSLQTPQNQQMQQRPPNISSLFPSISSLGGGGQSVLTGLGQIGHGIGQLGHNVGQHLFGATDGSSPQGQQMPFGGHSSQQSGIVPQLSVHSEFSPSVLNGPAAQQPQQPSQPQQQPSLTSLWNGWNSGATADSAGAGVGAVVGQQAQNSPAGEQQRNQPNAFVGHFPQQQSADFEQQQQQQHQRQFGQQSATASEAKHIQSPQQQQQVWVGKR